MRVVLSHTLQSETLVISFKESHIKSNLDYKFTKLRGTMYWSARESMNWTVIYEFGKMGSLIDYINNSSLKTSKENHNLHSNSCYWNGLNHNGNSNNQTKDQWKVPSVKLLFPFSYCFACSAYVEWMMSFYEVNLVTPTFHSSMGLIWFLKLPTTRSTKFRKSLLN